MATPAPRSMPRLLKATYLADQEYLLEETRATGLYYFPGPIVWIVIWGLFALFTAAAAYNWSGQIAAWSNALSTIAGWIHVSAFATYLFYVFLFLVFLGFLRLLIRYLRWISTVYAVTSRRVIIQKGILGRDFDEIPVLQVRGVDVHQSFLQRVLGYGTVRVSSEGGNRIGNEDWKGIPKPFRFQKLIEDAVANLQPSGPVTWVPSTQTRR
jgi:membrane protein YdbS with pleckstrin-like domain